MTVKTILIVLFAAIAPMAVNGYYGFSGDPAHREGWVESTIVPVNSYMLRMVQPDGVERIFQRDPAQPESLICPEPWVGEGTDRQMLVMTNPEFNGGQTGFLFSFGRLKKMLLDGKEYNISGGVPRYAKIGDLWPEVSEETVKGDTRRYVVQWAGRFKLWYRNPNHAAAIIVEAMILLFAVFGLRSHLVVKILALPFLLLCFYGLVRTGSRGGFVALVAGLSCLFMFRAREFLSAKRLLLLIGVFAGFAAIVFFGGMGERFTTGLMKEGYTDVSRIPIWVEAPRMMVASPWGWADSGDAYINWFQPLNRFHVPGGFLNTHLNALVDAGWPGRVCYVLAWMAILFYFADCARRGRGALPFAICTAMFVGSIFNSLGHVHTLWIIPAIIVAVALLRWRPWERKRELLAPISLAIVATASILSVLAWFGTRGENGVEIRGDGKRVVVNGSEAKTWVVNDDRVLDGGYKGIMGKEVRQWFGSHRDAAPVGFASKMEDVPSHAERLVLAGKTCSSAIDGIDTNLSRFDRLRELVLISPPFGWQAVPKQLLDRCKVKLVAGSFAYKLANGSAIPPEWVEVVPGCELYIPQWMNFMAD